MNFELNFLKNGHLFQKTGEPFLVESTKNENTTFTYKIGLSQRTEFCQQLLYFFENFVSVEESYFSGDIEIDQWH